MTLGMYVVIDCRGSALRRGVGITHSEQVAFQEGKLFVVKIKDLKTDCVVLTDGNKTFLVPAKKVPLSLDYVNMKAGRTKATRNFLFNKRLHDPWVIQVPARDMKKQASEVFFG